METKKLTYNTVTRFTFMPLKRGYRCNQTGDFTRHPKSYALSKNNTERNEFNNERETNLNTLGTPINGQLKHGHYWMNSAKKFIYY
jgi:hypothetical protein